MREKTERAQAEGGSTAAPQGIGKESGALGIPTRRAKTAASIARMRSATGTL